MNGNKLFMIVQMCSNGFYAIAAIDFMSKVIAEIKAVLITQHELRQTL